MSDAVFWGVLISAIVALAIAIAVLVSVTRERRRRERAAETALGPKLVDVFADAGDRPVRVRGTVHAGDSMVIEPVSGEPVLWFRLDGFGHPVEVETDESADFLFPFVVRRRGDVVVHDLIGAEARLAADAGFVVPLDRFGHRDYEVDDGFDTMEYELTAEVRDRVRVLVGADADRITTLDRLALLPGTDVTVTCRVRRCDDGTWLLEGDTATPLVVSALDDESDATHPRPSGSPIRRPAQTAADDESTSVAPAAGVGGALAGGVAVAATVGRRGRSAVSSPMRRVSRGGGASSMASRSARVPADVRRAASVGRVGQAGRVGRVGRLGGGAGGRLPGGAGQLSRTTRSGGVAGIARRAGGRHAGQASRLARVGRSGGGMRSMSGGSGFRRLLRLGRGGSLPRTRLPIRTPRVG